MLRTLLIAVLLDVVHASETVTLELGECEIENTAGTNQVTVKGPCNLVDSESASLKASVNELLAQKYARPRFFFEPRASTAGLSMRSGSETDFFDLGSGDMLIQKAGGTFAWDNKGLYLDGSTYLAVRPPGANRGCCSAGCSDVCPSTAAFTTPTVSVESFVKFTGLPGGIGTFHVIAQKIGGYSGGGHWALRATPHAEDNNRLHLWTQNYDAGTTHQRCTCDIEMELEKWYHTALTFDGSNDPVLYLDGVSCCKDPQRVGEWTGTGITEIDSQGLTIGHGDGRLMRGVISFVKVYDDFFTAADVAKLSAAAHDGNLRGAVAL